MKTKQYNKIIYYYIINLNIVNLLNK